MALAQVARALGSTISRRPPRPAARRGRGRARRRSRRWRTPPRVDHDARGRCRRSPAPRGASRPMPGGVDEDLDLAADQLVAAGRRDRVLQLGQLTEPLAHQPRRDLPVEVGRVRAVLPAVGEEPAPVQLGLLDEPQQLVVVLLGLTRVADDEVAAEGGVRLATADVVDAPQEALAVAPPAHPAQQRLADVLQREVEVRHAGVDDGVDQAVAEVARVEVQQADAVDAVGDGPHERDDRPGAELVGDVLAVGRQVLGDEHDLPRLQLVDLGEDRGHGPAALRARGTTGWRRSRTSGRSPRRS